MRDRVVSETLHVIDPRGVYSRQALQKALGLSKTTLAREIRLGRLRVSRRSGRYFILGSWVLEWLREGEIRRKQAGAVRDSRNAQTPDTG
jgi:hypothetical protein